MRSPKGISPTETNPVDFEEVFSPSKLYACFEDLFVTCETAIELLTDLLVFCQDLRREGLHSVSDEIVEATCRIFSSAVRCLSSIRILCNFGYGPEATAFSRRLWECWLDAHFISTDPDRRAFYYNRAPKISGLVKLVQLRRLKEEFGNGNLAQFERFMDNIDSAFQNIANEFREKKYYFPKNPDVLLKEFKNKWCELSRYDMIERIKQDPEINDQVYEQFRKSQVIDYSAYSQNVHGQGIYELTFMKNSEGLDYFAPWPGSDEVITALQSGLFYTRNCIRLLVRIANPKLFASSFGKRIMAFDQSVSDFNQKY